MATALATGCSWADESPQDTAASESPAEEPRRLSFRTEQVVYKTEPRKLTYTAIVPEADAASDAAAEPGASTSPAAARRAGVVFFHGGGWVGGKPGQFRQQSEELAARGVCCFLVEYRLRSKDKTPATACVEDAWDAWAAIVGEADRWHLDTERLAVGGGSAGGHIAACLGTGVVPPQRTDGGTITPPEVRPAAMVLFNPGVCLAEFEGYMPVAFENTNENKVGCEPRLLSPLHHVDAQTPPTLIVHGTADTTISIRSPALFVERLQQFGTKAELKRHKGQGHGFFNSDNRGGGDYPGYSRTLAELLQFLDEQGWFAASETTTAR